MIETHSRHGGRSSGWLLVGVLLAAYALSFVDRQILSLLVEDLRTDLKISDAQIGLLQGPAFGVFYAVMGLPFGWLADRVHRIRLIAAGLLLWTLMTLLGGLSESFGMLLVTRMGVGVGEAALVPAAVSLLADRFAPDRRALPLAIFTAGVSVGAGLALVLGGALVAFANGGAQSWSLFAGREAWQIVLILAGLLGIPLAAIVLALPEPERRSAVTSGDGALFGYLGRHRRLFALMLGGSSLLYLFSYALSAWMPTLFVRAFGWAAEAAGLRLGLLVLGGALIGNLLSGALATMLVRRGRANGTLLTMAIGAALLAPAAILGPLAPDVQLAQVAVALIYFALALCFGVASASFVAVTPAHLRGRMAAVYLSAGNLVGLGLGPPSVGLILESGFGDPARVGAALAMVASVTTISGALLLERALLAHQRRATEID